MADFKQIVKAAQVVLEAHEIYQDSVVREAWKTMTWKVQKHPRGDSTARVEANGNQAIFLYPALQSSPRAVEDVLGAFALCLYRRGGERSKSIWEKKLCVPTEDQVRKFDEALKSKQNRETCNTYEDVVHTYPQKGGSVDRLAAINLANALLANNISYPDSVGVNIYTWGPTAEYATLKKYHSLIPLVSAYAPASVYDCPGNAFAAWVAYDLNTVLDLSVAFGVKAILRNLIKRAA